MGVAEVRAVFEGPYSVQKLMRESAFTARLQRLINRDLPGLSINEKTVLAFAHIAAEDGLQAFKKDEIIHAMGMTGIGTNRGIEKALEEKGYIKIVFFQRGRKIWVREINKWTAEPPNTTPHWRSIFDRSKNCTPTLPIQKLREVPNVMAEVVRLQQERNLPLAEAQIVLMAYGCQALAQERDMAA